jgi:integrase
VRPRPSGRHAHRLPVSTAGRNTEAAEDHGGIRTIPLLPALRRVLVAWRLRSPHARPDDLVVATAAGAPVQERNLRRALEDAKHAARLDGGEERLSWHSLRHSFASMLATDLELPARRSRA